MKRSFKKDLGPYKIVINNEKYENKLNKIHKECFNDEKPYIEKDMTSMIVVSKNNDESMCYLLVEPRNKEECFIWSVCTGLEYRSRGCIQTLFKKAFAFFKIKNFKKFSLLVRKNNEVAINLYKKLGFVSDPYYLDFEHYKMSKDL